jgi:hypothetical protein
VCVEVVKTEECYAHSAQSFTGGLGGKKDLGGRKRVGKKYDKLAGLFGLCLSVQLLLLEDQVDASMDDRLAVLRRR